MMHKGMKTLPSPERTWFDVRPVWTAHVIDA